MSIEQMLNRGKEIYKNKSKYIKEIGRIALISSIVITADKAILRPSAQSNTGRQLNLASAAYASSDNGGENTDKNSSLSEYDSGWKAISRGETLVLEHKLGGNVDDYLVDMQFKDKQGNINNIGFGGFSEVYSNREIENMILKLDVDDPSYMERVPVGAWWENLTSESIRVETAEGSRAIDYVRIRIFRL